MVTKNQKPLLPGTFVRVRSLQEVMSTLDSGRTYEAIPFMPEMAKYCDKKFVVSKRVERTCEEAEISIKRIQNVVFLDSLRCDGSFHGDCQKGCMIFWKDIWLERIDQASENPNSIIESEAIAQLPAKTPDGLYICQSTELVKATTPLLRIDLMSYLRDIRSKTFSIPRLVRNVSYALFLRIRYILTKIPFRYLEGVDVPRQDEPINLQPGEWVQVKTVDEIRETLDKNGMNRGLKFTLDMVPYCGEKYRVLRRLETMIHEPTRKLIHLKDTVILEDSICKGCIDIKGGCPRENYNFWRESWLRRITVPSSIE